MKLEVFLCYPLLIAIAGFTYSYILTQPGEIFAGLNRVLSRLFKTDERLNSGRPLHPLFKLLIGCEKCIAGQLAFWSYLYVNIGDYGVLITIGHILFVCLTIFLAAVIKGIYKRTIEQWM